MALKFWVGVQWGQSNLMGRCLFSLGWPLFYLFIVSTESIEFYVRSE